MKHRLEIVDVGEKQKAASCSRRKPPWKRISSCIIYNLKIVGWKLYNLFFLEKK
jgi:hypothetical protein